MRDNCPQSDYKRRRFDTQKKSVVTPKQRPSKRGRELMSELCANVQYSIVRAVTSCIMSVCRICCPPCAVVKKPNARVKVALATVVWHIIVILHQHIDSSIAFFSVDPDAEHADCPAFKSLELGFHGQQRKPSVTAAGYRPSDARLCTTLACLMATGSCRSRMRITRKTRRAEASGVSSGEQVLLLQMA
jgi:hypothetical protein